jgi:hypothetical protein
MSDTPWNLQDYKDLLKSKGRIVPTVTKELLREYYERSNMRDTEHLHPSELSKRDWCSRAAYYKINGYPAAPERYKFDRLNVFEEGNYIHSKWQKWLWNAGILVGVWKCLQCPEIWYGTSPTNCPQCNSEHIKYGEVPIRDDEHRIIGHADGEIHDANGRALIEIKSVGIGTVRWELPSLYQDYEDKKITLDEMWANIKRPFPSHLRQGNIYMHCRKIDTMIFIYEWKASQQVKEFEMKYNAQIVEPILAECKNVMNHLEDGVVPDRPTWAKVKSCAGCKYCPYRGVCWDAQ